MTIETDMDMRDNIFLRLPIGPFYEHTPLHHTCYFPHCSLSPLPDQEYPLAPGF
jgi:hypothetical protein